jgi:hypothetical protein
VLVETDEEDLIEEAAADDGNPPFASNITR